MDDGEAEAETRKAETGGVAGFGSEGGRTHIKGIGRVARALERRAGRTVHSRYDRRFIHRRSAEFGNCRTLVTGSCP
ncbi:hypothetical protein GCM10022223_46230 [Kineosporia mesophila]|uniref:Uncharacterized protein n=1 Tax=Kineosporia mesophila TaxID=566012 RepID=A0ABP7A343_9ACTN